MKTPAFVTEFKDWWLVTEDTYIHPSVKECGHLNWDKVFEQVVAKVKSTGKTGTMLDIGAFIGDTTAWFSPFLKCITFEPQRDAFTCLIHNIPYHIHFPFPVGNGESVDLDNEVNVAGNLGSRSVKKGTSVQTVRIDDLGLDDVVLMKVDVEGWEPNVLEGAKETIARCKPIVVAEVNLEPLKKNGFIPHDISKYFPGWENVVIYTHLQEQWDTMFVPPA